MNIIQHAQALWQRQVSGIGVAQDLLPIAQEPRENNPLLKCANDIIVTIASTLLPSTLSMDPSGYTTHYYERGNGGYWNTTYTSTPPLLQYKDLRALSCTSKKLHALISPMIKLADSSRIEHVARHFERSDVLNNMVTHYYTFEPTSAPSIQSPNSFYDMVWNAITHTTNAVQQTLFSIKKMTGAKIFPNKEEPKADYPLQYSLYSKSIREIDLSNLRSPFRLSKELLQALFTMHPQVSSLTFPSQHIYDLNGLQDLPTTNIERLCMGRFHCSQSVFPACPNLEHLSLFSEPSFHSIWDLQYNKRRYARSPETNMVSQLAPFPQNLRTLHMPIDQIGELPEAMKRIAKLSHLQELELRISLRFITDDNALLDGFRELKTLPQLKKLVVSLKNLHVANRDAPIPNALIDIIAAQFPALEHLSLRLPRDNGTTFQSIAKNLKTLKELALYSVPGTLRKKHLMQMKQLEKLYIEMTFDAARDWDPECIDPETPPMTGYFMVPYLRSLPKLQLLRIDLSECDEAAFSHETVKQYLVESPYYFQERPQALKEVRIILNDKLL